MMQNMEYFYGDAGRGKNSRLKRFLRRGHLSLLQTFQQRSSIYITNEFRISKLCCLCHQPTVHPPKQTGKPNLGIVICINPDCIGRKFGCIARSRDANAARIVSGLHQQYFGSAPAAFCPSSTPVGTGITKLLKNLIDNSHPGKVAMVFPVPGAGGVVSISK